MIIFLIALALAAPQEDLVKSEAYVTHNIPYNGLWYSGYLSITDDGEKQLHYFFFPNDNQPVILWLNGGPGCSALTGALIEHGPFVFAPGQEYLIKNEESWVNLANMLYLESPAGVGYSFGDKKTNDLLSAQENLIALLKFYQKFPEYSNRDLYIAGESYAGIYIPNFVNQIIDYNSNAQTKIPLKGMIIGNGCTDPKECTVEAAKMPYYKYQFLKYHNFLDAETFKEVELAKDKCFGSSSDECKALREKVETQSINGYQYNPYNVYGVCYTGTVEGESYSPQPESFELGNIPPCADAKGQYKLLRNEQFRKDINIIDKSPAWVRCASLDYTKDPRASYYLYEKIMKNNIRILKFSGDVDGVVPITGTLYWINKLQQEYNLPVIQHWTPWYKSGQDGKRQNAGNILILEGLTFMSIRNAGHMVPADQREAALLMLDSFINQHQLYTE